MRRPPVLAARETPRSTIPLENLPAPSRRAATVLPPAPAFSDPPVTTRRHRRTHRHPHPHPRPVRSSKSVLSWRWCLVSHRPRRSPRHRCRSRPP
ncbi:hypothetical protein [Streptomyces olivochromogenes]|uniref:hypothetical protein n=1 Tax=Streptomyces olivochromogenes TaxID=1963 RepID=UPI00350E4E93